jgi:uncharacterized protein DUF4352
MRLSAPILAPLVIATGCSSSPQPTSVPVPSAGATDPSQTTNSLYATAVAGPVRTALPLATPAAENVQATVEAAVQGTLAATKPSPTAAPPRPTATPQRATTPATATPLPKQDPVRLTGSGDVQTKQFELRGGNYSVAWKGLDATRSRVGCVLYGSLMSPGSDSSVQRLSGSSREGADNSGTTEWYSVRSGKYYLKMNTTCAPWSVAIAAEGDDAVTALPDVQAVPAPPSEVSSTASATAQKWQVTPKGLDAIPTSLVSNEYGLTRQQNPTGKFMRVTFSLKNLQNRSAYITGSDFELVDSRNRTYDTDFQTRQVQGSTSQPFDHSNIAPGATVVLTLTFDVAPDASGLTLRMR